MHQGGRLHGPATSGFFGGFEAWIFYDGGDFSGDPSQQKKGTGSYA